MGQRERFLSLEDEELLFRKACGTTVITNHCALIEKLYKLGASHVFKAPDFWDDLQPFLIDDQLNNFLNKHFPCLERQRRQDFSSLLTSHKLAQLPLLLTGESGTGKTYLAKKIHDYTNPKKVFIAKNLSEIPSNLMESELFGHKKGSFTGATIDKKGLLERVNGGTLFLDEISGLSLEVQMKLLKVIEEKEFTPIGATRSIKVTFHLISATCDDLQEMIKGKKMRPDFLARINALQWHLIPLRERKHDITNYLETLQKDYKRQIYFTPEAREALENYSWPNNIRELKNYYQRLQSLRASVIRNFEKQTPPNRYQRSICPSKGLPGLIEEVEAEIFRNSYHQNQGRPNHICKELKISKSVFYRLSEQLEKQNLKEVSP